MKFKTPYISDEEGKELKERFIKIFTEFIIPAYKGADQLLDWIKQTDFFEAPASTMYHNCCKYGLLKHSLNVYDRLLKLIKAEYGDEYYDALGVDAADVAMIALCHDLCKANCYSVEQRNTKDKDDKWIKVDFYKYSPAFEYGHGEKSVFIIQNFIQGLSLNVALAIRFHMGAAGGGGSREKDDNALKEMENFPIIMWTNFADMAATYLDESREPEEE